jgi:hypothetical protein
VYYDPIVWETGRTSMKARRIYRILTKSIARPPRSKLMPRDPIVRWYWPRRTVRILNPRLSLVSTVPTNLCIPHVRSRLL